MGIFEVMNIVLGLVVEPLALVYSTYFFMAHVERKVFLPRKYYIAAFTVYIVIITFTSVYFRDDRISAAAAVISVAVMGYFFFQKSLVGVVYDIIYIGVIFMCQSAIILAVQALYLELVNTNPLLFADISIALKAVSVIPLTKLLVYAIERVKFAELPKRQLFSILILPAFSLFFMFSFFEVSQVYFQLYGMGLYALNALIVIVLNLYFVYLFGYVFKARNLEKDLSIYKKHDELQFRYYEELEKKYQESRKMIHDMKNHLQAIEDLYSSGETERGREYVRDMYHMLNTYGGRYYSENRMLNIILNDKFAKAAREGVKTTAMIGDVDLEFIKDIDATTIFANLLDNAVEAAAGTEGANISVKVDGFNDFLVISIRNSSRDKVKKEKEGHMGLGLVNVRQTLEKYHGTLQTGSEGQEYQVNITIPKGGE